MIKVGLINEFSGDMLEHIAGFYIHAGWIGKDDDTSFLLPALKGSALVAGAFDEKGKIIGSARVLSDGCSDAYIQDVVVDPAYRGQGIGSELIRVLTDALLEKGVDWIGLVGEPGTEEFYRKQNWVAKPGYTLWQMKKK
jgi:spermidine synthase